MALPLIDLGSAPPSNAYLSGSDLRAPETWYPLRVLVCSRCWLVQTEDHARRDELFAHDYAYFSSYSTSWLAHAQRYLKDVVARFGLSAKSTVVEIAANDGYLLQYVKAAGIPCFGVEPTSSTAAAAREKGIEIIEEFFGTSLAERLAAAGRSADLMVANNVLAHVPDINDFVRGFTLLLRPAGVATFEFQHLLNLVQQNEFDTIYHEHYSYLSLTAVMTLFAASGLAVFDVEELPTHGGSLRVYAQRRDTGRRDVGARVEAVLSKEARAGMTSAAFYEGFQARADRVKHDLLAFLIDAARRRQKVAAYGAAAKGNTLLNYSGVRRDTLPWVVDLNPAKQGKFLPGSRIPIVAEERIRQEKPDCVLILPWNLRDEIAAQLSYVRNWDGKFAVAVPELRVW